MYFFPGFKNNKNIKNNENKKQLNCCISINFCSFFSPTILKILFINKMLKKLHLMFRWPETCCFFFAHRWFCAGAVKPILMLRNDFVGEVKEGFWILLFLLQESKRDKRLHYSEKFPDFVVSSAGVKEG